MNISATAERATLKSKRKRDLVDLSGFRVRTYAVDFMNAPAAKEPFEAFRGTAQRSSEDVYHFSKKLFSALKLDRDREHFIVLLLNNKNRLSGFKLISTGTLTASLVHPREVFHAAIVLRAAAVLFIHNHPSGDPAPSPEDIDLTKTLKLAADILAVRVIDHVIIGDDRYFSFSDKGMV